MGADRLVCAQCGLVIDETGAQFCPVDGTRLRKQSLALAQAGTSHTPTTVRVLMPGAGTDRMHPPPMGPAEATVRVLAPGESVGESTARISVAPLLDDPLVGHTVGRYRVLQVLGEGGMATVYQAEHEELGRLVALKVLRPEVASDPVMAARFGREATAASRIESPHVVRLHDFGRTDAGLLYMALELVEGEPLSVRLAREGALPPTEAVRIAMEIARGLAAAHEVGVVHRDLKPDNVLLTAPGGTAQVVDFGLARMIADDPSNRPSNKQLTRLGALVGTPTYMSPEAAARQPVDRAGDLYSLGVILFQMLVGRPPFEHRDPVMLMGMHLRVPAELLREARRDLAVPDALEKHVDRLLQKDPDDRPQNAEEVATLLGSILRAMQSPTADIELPEAVDSAETALPLPPRFGQAAAPPPLPRDPHATVRVSLPDSPPRFDPARRAKTALLKTVRKDRAPKKKRSGLAWAGVALLALVVLCLATAVAVKWSGLLRW